MVVAIESSWQRLTRWAAVCPLDITFNPGATEAAIAKAEAALGLPFPADFRASLRIHDGEDWQQGIRWLDSGMLWLPVAKILACWQEQQTYYARWGEDEYAWSSPST